MLSSVLLFLGKFATPSPHYPKDSLAQKTRRCLGAARVPKCVSPMDEGCKSREGKRAELRRVPDFLLLAARRI